MYYYYTIIMTEPYFVVFISQALPGVVVGLCLGINGLLKSFTIPVTSVLVIKMDEVLKESLCIENAFVCFWKCFWQNLPHNV